MSGLSWNGNLRRFQTQFHDAQMWLDRCVLRDAAPFVPIRSGTLLKSGSTTPNGGSVQWSAPYAAPVYYRKKQNGSPLHPQAQRLWFEAAKARCGQDWVRGVKKRAGGD